MHCMGMLESLYDASVLTRLFEQGAIQMVPVGLLRGMTFLHTWLVNDEAQNSTPEQLKMVLTRIGQGSKLVITGDVTQHDRPGQVSGLEDFVAKLRNTPDLSYIKHVEMTVDDIVRDPAVKEVLRVYDAQACGGRIVRY